MSRDKSANNNELCCEVNFALFNVMSYIFYLPLNNTFKSFLVLFILQLDAQKFQYSYESREEKLCMDGELSQKKLPKLVPKL